MPSKIKKYFSRGFRILLFIGFCLAAWAFVWEPSRLTEKNYDLVLPNWPKACAGFKVAVASDIHAGAPYIGTEKIDRMVAMIQAQKPDVVLLPGDFVIQEVLGGNFITPEALAQQLKPLLKTSRVYAALGNHDAWLDSARVQKAFENAGIAVLDDTAVSITHTDVACQFWLVGLSDYTEGKREYAKAFAMVPEGAATLAFTHSPDIFPGIAAENFSLLIAGHTHGGQVRLPFLGRPVVPSNYGQRYAIGHIVEAKRHLLVSPGIGTSILPVRFGVPPEISYLHLHSEEGKAP
jgi:uncharacterized protein